MAGFAIEFHSLGVAMCGYLPAARTRSNTWLHSISILIRRNTNNPRTHVFDIMIWILPQNGFLAEFSGLSGRKNDGMEFSAVCICGKPKAQRGIAWNSNDYNWTMNRNQIIALNDIIVGLRNTHVNLLHCKIGIVVLEFYVCYPSATENFLHSPIKRRPPLHFPVKGGETSRADAWAEEVMTPPPTGLHDCPDGIFKSPSGRPHAGQSSVFPQPAQQQNSLGKSSVHLPLYKDGDSVIPTKDLPDPGCSGGLFAKGA